MTPARTEVPDWFDTVDQSVFDCLLRWQSATGDLIELGCYLGENSVLLGQHLRDGEVLRVCDLFGAPAADPVRGELPAVPR